VPSILRDAILAADDKDFFTHSGVDYRALPRVIHKTATSSVRGWWNRDGFRLRFPQGGSTLTQQLVRGYFLQDRWSRENGAALFRDSRVSRLVALIVGVPTMNKPPESWRRCGWRCGSRRK
jgi:membrane peptidoglycan carboxypeptidase